MTRREPTQKLLSAWHVEIERSGTKRIAARRLLGAFGLERRGIAATARIRAWLQHQDPPVFPNGLEFVRSLDDLISLSHVEVTQIGHPVTEERILMERFEADIMPHLGLEAPVPKFRPPGSRDQLDFLCRDGYGAAVVVEMKKGDGERRVVEQVLRYIRLVRGVPGCDNPRGVVITGQADLHTRRALEELEPQYHIEWYVYGVDNQGEILVKHVPVSASRL